MILKFDKLNNYKEWEEHQERLGNLLTNELKELVSKYRREGLESDSIVNLMYSFSQSRYDEYYHMRDNSYY